MKQSLLLLLALFTIFIACNKTPDPQADTITMLRTGKWKISSGTVTMRGPNGVKAAQTYYPGLRKICLRDDYIIFDSSNHATVYSGTSRCSAADPDSVGFIWQLKNNEKNFDFFNAYKIIDSVAQTVYLDNTVTPSIYRVKYDTATSHEINIRDGKISNITENTFTLEYSLVGQYNDTTDNHYDAPILRPDTFIYRVNYTH